MPGVTVTKRIHFSTRSRGKREIVEGAREAAVACSPGRVPRVSRLMALAIKVDGLIASGAIADQAEAARLGHVTRARMTQIMNLLLLAPDIQEAVLNLPAVERGREPIVETQLRPIVRQADWEAQRRMWLHVLAERRGGVSPSVDEDRSRGCRTGRSFHPDCES